MILPWKILSRPLLLRFSSIIMLLCSILMLQACIALDAPLQASNNSTSNTAVKTPPAEERQTNNIDPLDNSKWRAQDKQVSAKNERKRESHKPNLADLKKSFHVKDRMSLTASPGSTPLSLTSKRFSFKTKNTNIRLALKKFANENKLDMSIDKNIKGNINVNFKNLSLTKSMALMLGKHNYYWDWNNGLIRISRLQTKVFIIDYLKLTRNDQETKPNDSNTTFWDDIEKQIGSLISNQGRFVSNRISGTVQITDIPARIQEAELFINSLQQALHRQVEIEARILEVSLSDDHSLGIDWNAISIKGITGSLTNAVSGNNQGLNLKTSTLNLGYNHNNFSALISALEEQGSVKVVSQPRLRIINNQPALIKVGTDRTFFTQTVNQTTASNGVNQTLISDEPYVITEGLVLSVTPQISQDRWIMLDISPVITRITDIVTSAQGSTAPVLDIKQASTLIRARDGEMVILGGLIQKESSQTERQVPFFAKLPVVGSLFEGDYEANAKKELIIFLVPRLVL